MYFYSTFYCSTVEIFWKIFSDKAFVVGGSVFYHSESSLAPTRYAESKISGKNVEKVARTFVFILV